MRRKNIHVLSKNKKYFVGYIGLVIIFVIIIPLTFVSLFNLFNGEHTGKKHVSVVKCPRYISIERKETGKTERVKFEEYIKGVVASEMPSTFHKEALKAQAVAARTYALSKLQRDDHLCDTTHCQVYRSEKEQIRIHGKGWKETGWKKIKEAVNSTSGEAMYYDGKLVMQPLYFSSSGGKTENSEDVFSNAYPYLVSVSSPYENEASHKNEKITMSIKEFASTLEKSFKNENFGKIKKSKIDVLSRTLGGRVEKIKIGKVTLQGSDIRTAFNLPSTLFELSFSGDKITITTNGSGHGVGMSQYGANGMAKKGYGYKEILAHYYYGVIVQ